MKISYEYIRFRFIFSKRQVAVSQSWADKRDDSYLPEIKNKKLCLSQMQSIYRGISWHLCKTCSGSSCFRNEYSGAPGSSANIRFLPLNIVMHIV